MMRRTILAAALGLGLAAGADAATILIVNSDGANEGFNDPTPAAPVGGNPGTTIGQQRLNVFQAAGDIWGALLPGAVTIRVEARFNPQSCDASSAVLGSAGPIEVFSDFAGAELTGTWYHVALANRLAGVDLSPGVNDIVATFNSSIDNNNNCLANTDWYYGLDGNEGPDVELLPVVLHELGHGLGFSTLVNNSTGAEFFNDPDVYETFIRDNTLGITWDQMTNVQRKNSAVNTGNVVWNGPEATAESPNFLGGTPTLFVNSGGSLPATMPIGLADFGAEITEAGVTGNVVLADDATGTATDACEPLVNGGAVAGNIALIDRGTCTFVSKALAAQAAGAIGVIIANNAADPDPIGLGGSDPTVTIPVVSVTLADGNAIKAELGGGVNVTLGLNPALRAGADAANRVKLYAPNPVQGGSSISHWDVTANPNLLMEPAINDNLSGEVDLTLAHFTDIGWIDAAAAPVLALEPPTITFPTVAFGDTVCEPVCVINTGDALLNVASVTGCDSGGFSVDLTGFNTSIAPGDTSKFLVCFTPVLEGADTCSVNVTSDGGSGAIAVQVGSVTGLGDIAAATLILGPAVPTPFTASAEVRFTLPEADRVNVSVFDLQGRRLRSLAEDAVLSGGTHGMAWDGRDAQGRTVAEGIYFVRVATERHGTKVTRAIRLNR